jgi:hypothetical protein
MKALCCGSIVAARQVFLAQVFVFIRFSRPESKFPIGRFVNFV